MEGTQRWEAAKVRVRAAASDPPILLGMDLDCTLFPNSTASYDGSIPRLVEAINAHALIDVWVSGRRRTSACRNANELGIPLPEFFIAELGTSLLRKSSRGELIDEPAWQKEFEGKLTDWDRERVKHSLRKTELLEFQEKRPASPYKLGYRFEPEKRADAVRAAADLARDASRDALVVTSIDVDRHIGFIDIIPFCADKRAAVDWLRKELKILPRHVVFAGDSGNDVSALTAGWLGIVVKNAQPEVKGKVTTIMRAQGEEAIVHHAEGVGDLNGNYSSGIIEGLIVHGLIDPRYAFAAGLQAPKPSAGASHKPGSSGLSASK